MRNVKDQGRSSDSFGARRWAGMGREAPLTTGGLRAARMQWSAAETVDYVSATAQEGGVSANGRKEERLSSNWHLDDN